LAGAGQILRGRGSFFKISRRGVSLKAPNPLGHCALVCSQLNIRLSISPTIYSPWKLSMSPDFILNSLHNLLNLIAICHIFAPLTKHHSSVNTSQKVDEIDPWKLLFTIFKPNFLFLFRQSSISPVPSQSEDRNHNPSTTPFPSNGISSFEWPTGVTISTSTVSTTHVEKVDDDILASIGVGDQIVSSEEEDQNTQKETIIQLVPDQVRLISWSTFNVTVESSWGWFYQHFTSSFYTCRFQKCKKTV